MQLTPHFTADEVRWYQIPAHFRSNALATLALAERYRVVWGNNPVKVHGLWRSPAANAAEGGSPSSQHLDATGIDVSVPALPYGEAVTRVMFAAEVLQLTGEFVYYDSQSHFHFTLPTRGEVGQVLRKSAEGYRTVHAGAGYPPVMRSLPESGRTAAVALALGGLLVLGANT